MKGSVGGLALIVDVLLCAIVDNNDPEKMRKKLAKTH